MSGFRLRARLDFSIPAFSSRPARHYPRLRIQRPSFERRGDFNPHDSCAAQRTLCPLLTSPPRSPALRSAQSGCPDTVETSRGKIGRLPRTPAGSTTPTFDGSGLRDHLLARPAGQASLSGSCPSGRGFAPRFFQTPPRDDALRFANPSPPSGWIEDSHLPSCRSCSAHNGKGRDCGHICLTSFVKFGCGGWI